MLGQRYVILTSYVEDEDVSGVLDLFCELVALPEVDQVWQLHNSFFRFPLSVKYVSLKLLGETFLDGKFERGKIETTTLPFLPETPSFKTLALEGLF